MKTQIPNTIGDLPESEISFNDIFESHKEFVSQELNELEECYQIMPPPEKDIVTIIEASNIASLPG